MVKRLGPGRPAAEEVSTEAAKVSIDADKIPTTDPLFAEANTILKETAKNKLHEASLYTAKKAAKLAKAEFEDVEEELAPEETKRPIQKFNLGGMSPDDLKKMAEVLPEEQREPFLRQALGMTTSVNPVMGAWFNRPKPEAPQQGAPAAPMSFADMLQGMMGMVIMQIQVSQQKADDWRMQQEYESKAWRERTDELREIMRGTLQQPGPNPEAEALKVQIDILKDSLKDTKDLLKEIATKKPEHNGDYDEMRKENLRLMQEGFEKEKADLVKQLTSLESRLADNTRYNVSMAEVLKKYKDETGVELHASDAGELQVSNDHEYRMKQLELKEKHDLALETERLEELKLRRAESEKQTEMIKQIGVGVGTALFGAHFKGKNLEESSSNVKTLAGGIK